MSRPLIFLLASSLALPQIPAAAQAPAQQAGPPPAFEIRGKIVDTANKPIPRASISLRLKTNGLTIAGAFAGQDGSFRVTDLRPGTFSIRVAFIGYSPVIQDITIRPDKPVLDLGVAKLAPVPAILEAVTVKEERATVVTEPDKNAYRAKDLANASKWFEAVVGDKDVPPPARQRADLMLQLIAADAPAKPAS